ncbi:MAG: peptidoglycan DD-metalloendopeptidase family protein [Clostridia bacterium]|nr:peptidoglycan DD-metalloendopeptidase family protein [Clostridia bacterium]
MRKIKRFLSIIICLVFLSTLNLSVLAADNISKYEEELDAVRKQQKENAENLTGVEKEIALYSYDVAEIDSQVLTYTKNLASLQQQIKETQDTLDDLDESLVNANENYSVLNSTYANRLRQIYEDGIPSIFELIITSNGFTDLMLKLNLYSMILEHDKTLMNTYADKQNYINYIKEDIEIEKKRLEALKQGLETVKSELETKRQEKVDKINELNTKANELQETNKLLTEKRHQAMSDLDNEMAKIIKDVANQIKNGTASTFTGTEFAYPVPGYTIITTSFGEVYNLVDPAGSAHTGVDIAGGDINGTPIYAIQDGVIITSGYSNYGYGNYVIINHGECVDNNSSYISLYGHCSALVAKEGEKVKKGDLIGYVGTTGNSTGPHLHLEVRENGERIDPLSLYPSMSFTVL